jgi:hypothetical protein
MSRAVLRKFVSRLQPPPQKLESLNFGSRCFLGQLDALHTQNFDKLFFSGSCHTHFWFSTHFDAHKILHASIQYVVQKKLYIMEVNQ